jgi:galactokinase
MTGGGFGGSAIALAPVGAVDAIAAAAKHAFAEHGYREPDVFVVQPSEGARLD